MNQGLCDIGRFNHAYGLPAIIDGRSSGRYNVDFCQHPEALCSDYVVPSTSLSQFTTTIDTSAAKYLIGLIYWADHVQPYKWGFWEYRAQVKLFVDGGMKDDSFVDEFSEIVLESSQDAVLRKEYFRKTLGILLVEDPTASPTQSPSKSPVIESAPPTRTPSISPVVPEIPWWERETPNPIERPAAKPTRPVMIDISAPGGRDMPSAFGNSAEMQFYSATSILLLLLVSAVVL